MLSDIGGWGVSKYSGRSIFFFIKENLILATTRHHANNILLTINLHFDSDVRQWSYLSMYFCIVFGLNGTIERVANLNVTWICFCFDFVYSHAWCRCFSIVCLCFQDMQIKQVECKMNTKIVTHFKWKPFCDIFGQWHTQ